MKFVFPTMFQFNELEKVAGYRSRFLQSYKSLTQQVATMRADAKHLMERQVYEYDLTTFVHKLKALKNDL